MSKKIFPSNTRRSWYIGSKSFKRNICADYIIMMRKEAKNPSMCRRMVEKLLYLILTRLDYYPSMQKNGWKITLYMLYDLNYSVYIWTRLIHGKTQVIALLNAAYRVLQYLCPGQGLFFDAESKLHTIQILIG